MIRIIYIFSIPYTYLIYIQYLIYEYVKNADMEQMYLF